MLELNGIVAGHLFGRPRIALYAGIAAIAAAIGGPAEIVREIEIVGVVAGDAKRIGGFGVVPADEIDGWYHSKTADTFGVARNDTYNLYLAYYLGWTAYGRGNRGDAGVQGYARATEKMARDYAVQLQQCGS